MNREHLPNRRQQTSTDFVYAGNRWTLSVGRYDDGRPAEIFIQTGKMDNEMAAMARDVAVITSIALQHGAPVEVIRAAVTRAEDGGPASIAGKMLDELCAGPKETA